jgi:hypothetical protein
MLRAYMLKDSFTIVTQKSMIHNAKDTDFTEVTLILSMDEIKEWAEEIELMGLDEETEEEDI